MAGSFGFAALGTGADALASSADTRVRYWNLFSGGDGSNMIAMLDAFRAANPGIDVKDSTLQWGNPFYTKLAMAAAGNRAPDLGVMHLGRVTGFSPGRLLDPWDVELLAGYGVREADFNPALWQRGVIDGRLYALPLDIHVQLCFYRKDVLKKAGLLGADGRMVPVTSADDWFGVHVLGIETPWLTDKSYAMLAIVITTLWWTVGFSFLLYLAALQSIPDHLYEAAKLDGANAWHRMVHITLPMLRNITGLVVTLQILASLQVFDQAVVMLDFGPGPENSTRTFVQYTLEEGFTSYRVGYASAISVIFFVIIAVVALARMWLLRNREEATR
ncbi:extracellular solute-binding protein [Streptomyces sp. PAN_FS17]|uniref:extracellular solute-binding protein n=1 Tax=Streptomyces sp. PAN_FS17 TaxID=1855351 RepID=UPI00210F0E31|nr:extracellular solute-binding protein [Streptomyces sp. PAN_FS17]